MATATSTARCRPTLHAPSATRRSRLPPPSPSCCTAPLASGYRSTSAYEAATDQHRTVVTQTRKRANEPGSFRDETKRLANMTSAPLLTIVVPTFNERANLRELARRIDTTLTDFAWELVFVDDDSPDETWKTARALGQEDARIRCIRRIRRRGLAGACIEGMLSSSAAFVAVMDADLQHDELILPAMLARLAMARSTWSSAAVTSMAGPRQAGSREPGCR